MIISNDRRRAKNHSLMDYLLYSESQTKQVDFVLVTFPSRDLGTNRRRIDPLRIDGLCFSSIAWFREFRTRPSVMSVRAKRLTNHFPAARAVTTIQLQLSSQRLSITTPALLRQTTCQNSCFGASVTKVRQKPKPPA